MDKEPTELSVNNPRESSVDLPAADVIAQMRVHRRQEAFADFYAERWPADVPDNCEASEVGTDCMELKLPEEQYCLCCQTYARICREWYATPEIQQRLTA